MQVDGSCWEVLCMGGVSQGSAQALIVWLVSNKRDLFQTIHDEELKREFDLSNSYRRTAFEDEFVRYAESMLTDVDKRIRKGKQRLSLSVKDALVRMFSLLFHICSIHPLPLITPSVNQHTLLIISLPCHTWFGSHAPTLTFCIVLTCLIHSGELCIDRLTTWPPSLSTLTTIAHLISLLIPSRHGDPHAFLK